MMLNDGAIIEFGEFSAKIIQDMTVTNTTKFNTEILLWKGQKLVRFEIIFFQKVLQNFLGNRMPKKRYKINRNMTAEMQKQGSEIMLVFFTKNENLAILDKMYVAYLEGVLRTILSKLPIYIFS